MDLLKIDVQSNEGQTLEGFKNSLKLVKNIIVEVSFYDFYNNKSSISEIENIINKDIYPTDKQDLNQSLFVKVRSTGSLLEAKVDLKDNNTARVNLLNPEDGISPGQACVFYSKDQYGHRVLGGGWIKE